MTTSKNDNFGLSRDAGPADGLHEIAYILDFVAHALIASREGNLPISEFSGVEEGLISLSRACEREIKRIAEVVPVSVERNSSEAAG